MSLEPAKAQPTESPDDILLGELVELPVEPSYVPQAVEKTPPAGPLFRDEFVLAETSDQEELALSLAPPEGLSPTERRIATMEPIPLTIDEEPKLTQFTLWELMILMTFLSVGLSTIYYLPPSDVAGVLGLLALVGQGLLMRFPPDNRHVNLAAWSLLAMYFVAAAVAFFQHVWA